jgi:hypothetical protein
MGPENKAVYEEKLEEWDEFGEKFVILQREPEEGEKLCRLLKLMIKLSFNNFFSTIYCLYFSLYWFLNVQVKISMLILMLLFKN